MAKTFSIKCPSCTEKVVLDRFAIGGLDELIAEERADAEDDARDEERDAIRYEGEEQRVGLTGGARPLHELAIAIERGDKDEAAHLLDRIAEDVGSEAEEEVQQGRFSLRAALQ